MAVTVTNSRTMQCDKFSSHCVAKWPQTLEKERCPERRNSAAAVLIWVPMHRKKPPWNHEDEEPRLGEEGGTQLAAVESSASLSGFQIKKRRLEVGAVKKHAGAGTTLLGSLRLGVEAAPLGKRFWAGRLHEPL